MWAAEACDYYVPGNAAHESVNPLLRTQTPFRETNTSGRRHSQHNQIIQTSPQLTWQYPLGTDA